MKDQWNYCCGVTIESLWESFRWTVIVLLYTIQFYNFGMGSGELTDGCENTENVFPIYI